jgi:formylglycine-generating enzyme required for sulfatase activity/tetratricopeptide (TPR) repeat protein/predicted Ser/Thr protein kinase
MVKRVTCPSCAYEFGVGPEADLAHLVCPHCEAAIPERAARGLSEVAEDLAPGFKPGQQLGNYVLESLLGSGGMGVVFRGRQLSLNRAVAIKLLFKNLAKNKMFVQRFDREATVLATLNHANIVTVFDRGREGDNYFIVMEYVEGETLKERLSREGKLPEEQVLQIGEQVLAGLEYAHRRGVVHRDIKPGNIMTTREKIVKIADFGLARLAKTEGGLDLTQDYHRMGTLRYMAPEQLGSARNIDQRADIYGFGVCLYELLTGKLPLGVFKMPSEVDSTLDVRWDDVITRSLSMDPNERFASAEAMAAALRELATTPRVTQARRQKEEETAVKVQGVLTLTACLSCGHESALTARQCEQCGASLEDIFDECPSCKIQNRLDVRKCPACGEDLAQHRKNLRGEAQAIQLRARQLVADRQFDQGLMELERLARFGTREYAAMRENAHLWIERVSERRERFLRRTYEAGKRMVVEGNIESALRLWSALPDNYQDIAVRRSELAAKAEAGGIALAEGNRFRDQGDVARAVAEWEKAAAVRPRDAELQKRLAAARNELGNLNLKRIYLKEASEEAARGNFEEARALCQKAFDLSPDDESALAVAKEIDAKVSEIANLKNGYLSQAREAAARSDFDEALALCRKALELDPHDESALHVANEIAAKRGGPAISDALQALQVRKPAKPKPPGALSERPRAKPILVALACLGALLLGLWFFALHLPRVRAEAAAKVAMEAEKVFNEAVSLKEAGKLSDSIALCAQVAEGYSQTIYAKKATDLSEEMQKLIADANASREAAEAVARKGDLDSLIAGFSKYQQILSGPPVTLVAETRESAARRLEEIRGDIVRAEMELATQDEKNHDWRAALERYRTVVEKLGIRNDPIMSKIARAQKQLRDCAAQVQLGREAFQASRWDAAYHAAAAALDLASADPDARSLLASIVPKLQPPPGMVLIPPGKYIVGGSEGNPRRTVDLPFGVFMATKEVTCGRFAEFLRATGRAAPPGWSVQAGNEDMPVTNVTWTEAAAFAAWAGCTLPTEEQWECACRGSSGQLYPWGDAWAPDKAVLGFGPASIGNAQADRSPFGCVDMAGNVAQWTATPLESRGKPQHYVVKGSSWAGMEPGRPTRVVAQPLPEGAANVPTLLVPDLKRPEWQVHYPSDLEMEYHRGMVGTEDYAFVLVRKWMPGAPRWAESAFPVTTDEKIGGQVPVAVEEETKPRTAASSRAPSTRGRPRGRSQPTPTPAPTHRAVMLDLSTGCVALQQESKEWLDVRDPCGVVRRLPLVSSAAPEPAKINDCKGALPKTEMTLEQAESAATRMAGRENARYINVGFRCAKPLWPLVSPAEEASKAPAK